MGLHDLGFKLTDADLTSIMAVIAPGMRSVGFFFWWVDGNVMSTLD